LPALLVLALNLSTLPVTLTVFLSKLSGFLTRSEILAASAALLHALGAFPHFGFDRLAGFLVWGEFGVPE
jgi:hypothetical protein